MRELFITYDVQCTGEEGSIPSGGTHPYVVQHTDRIPPWCCFPSPWGQPISPVTFAYHLPHSPVGNSMLYFRATQPCQLTRHLTPYKRLTGACEIQNFCTMHFPVRQNPHRITYCTLYVRCTDANYRYCYAGLSIQFKLAA